MHIITNIVCIDLDLWHSIFYNMMWENLKHSKTMIKSWLGTVKDTYVFLGKKTWCRKRNNFVLNFSWERMVHNMRSTVIMGWIGRMDYLMVVHFILSSFFFCEASHWAWPSRFSQSGLVSHTNDSHRARI